MKGDADPEEIVRVDGLLFGVEAGLGVVLEDRRSDNEISANEIAASFWHESESFVRCDRASSYSEVVSDDGGVWLFTAASPLVAFLPTFAKITHTHGHKH